VQPSRISIECAMEAENHEEAPDSCVAELGAAPDPRLLVIVTWEMVLMPTLEPER